MNTGPDLAHALRRSAELKEQLVAFGQGRSFERRLGAILSEAAHPGDSLDEETAIGGIDRFLLQFLLPVGNTVADRLVARRKDLHESDR
ncbi:hypothetical protein ABWJ92_03700 [Streptomyces sp. NPDC000609]|uniref:hypothetical protein n=1 Tax=Streptomyces sp. NPDC000609 TaxID=3160957 RepID=UPI003397F462